MTPRQAPRRARYNIRCREPLGRALSDPGPMTSVHHEQHIERTTAVPSLAVLHVLVPTGSLLVWQDHPVRGIRHQRRLSVPARTPARGRGLGPRWHRSWYLQQLRALSLKQLLRGLHVAGHDLLPHVPPQGHVRAARPGSRPAT